jgi:hypothetical protein
MRLGHGLALLGSLALIGCGGGGGSGDDGDDVGPDAIAPPGDGFQIVTPDIEIPAGGEETYCYYTTVTLDQAAGIKKWTSVMTPGSHHLIVFFTDSAQEPDGTLTPNCGFAGGGGVNLPIWTYSSGTPQGEMAMPTGVGQQIKQTQNMFVQMHYLNTNPNDPMTVHVTVNAETYAPEEEYIPASAFVSYSTDINIGTGVGTEGSIEHTCTPPAGTTFFTIGTHSHKRSVQTFIYDGDTEIYHSESWEHPADINDRIDAWMQEPHYQFSGQLRYHCDYVNDLNQPVSSGDSAATDEMCMAVGYHFPATEPTFCFDDFTL